MIAYLHGRIQIQQLTYIIIVVSNVGYKVAVPTSVLERATVGTELELYIHHHVREDASELFGFASFAELELFGQLISVSGIGPKAGLALLSQFTPDAIKHSIATNNTQLLTKVSGIGKKTAERLVLELKSKFEGAVLNAGRTKS
jgi:Holliday junction DNA helicase RuvA